MERISRGKYKEIKRCSKINRSKIKLVYKNKVTHFRVASFHYDIELARLLFFIKAENLLMDKVMSLIKFGGYYYGY